MDLIADYMVRDQALPQNQTAKKSRRKRITNLRNGQATSFYCSQNQAVLISG